MFSHLPPLFVLLALHLHQSVQGDCEDWMITHTDQLGPFFRPEGHLDFKIAPDEEINDPSIGVEMHGKIVNKNCDGIKGATVEVWYAGKTGTNYTFPPEKLWYRGKQQTDQNGDYKFLATFPEIYMGRPIIHYHFKVTTPGSSAPWRIGTLKYLEVKIEEWPSRAKWGQAGPNRPKWCQMVPNRVKRGHTGSNGAKKGQKGPTEPKVAKRAKRGQTRPNGVIWG